jgi:hypothetical protein
MPTRREQSDADSTDRKSRILADRSVREWYDGRSLRSALSADVDVRKLSLLLERLGLDPKSVVRLAKEEPDSLRTKLVQYAADLKRTGRLDTYIAKTFSGLRSFLDYRHVDFDGYPALSPVVGASIANERVPTPEELGRILQRLSLRGQSVAILMAHSGLRPQVLGGYRGEAGLVLGDLPELDLETLTFRETPFVVKVPAELSKTRTAYVSFGTAQSASILSAYLHERRERGERLTPKSPVIAPESDVRGAAKAHLAVARFHRGFLATGNVVAELARVLHASAGPGERLRVYVLRAYCSTRLLMAEGDGRISASLRESIMGHRGGGAVANRYHLGKRWGPELLAEARREYARAAEFLETNVSTKTDGERGTLETIIKAVEEATRTKSGASAAMTADDLLTIFKRAIEGRSSAAADGNGTAKGDGFPPASPTAPRRLAQRLVSAGELDSLLASGYRYVATVGERVVVEPSI